MRSVFASFTVALLIALVVGSVRVTLEVLRKDGRKVVVVFVVAVAGCFIASYTVDPAERFVRNAAASSRSKVPQSSIGPVNQTTWPTTLHPLLVLESSHSTTSRLPDPSQLIDQHPLVAF